ncbi:phosphatidate cytidylyltransferase [Nitratifractor sp.]
MNRVVLTGGLILALLSLATLILKIMRRRSGLPYRELGARIHSWWVMAGLFLALILSGKAGAVGLFALVSYLAVKEYFTMIPIRRVDRRIIFWAYLAIPLQYWWAYEGWYGMFIIWIPVYLFLLLPFRQILTGQTRGFLESTGKVQWGMMLFVFSVSHLAFLYGLPEVQGHSGVEMLLYLVVLTELNDIYQYLFGKSLGRRPIAPAISPGKTREGFLGALAATTLTAAALRYLTPFSVPQALAAGAVIATAGFVGDLVVSMIKRDVGIKDSGDLIPGHGGILDRIDSLTYTAPLFFHGVYYLFY